MHILSNYITHFRQTHTHRHTHCTVQVFFPFLLIWQVVQCLKSAKINNLQVIRKATFVFLFHTWKYIGKLISSHSPPPPNLGDVRSVNPGGLWQHLSTSCLITLIAIEWDDIRLIVFPQICGSKLWLLADSVPYASVWCIVFVFPSGIFNPVLCWGYCCISQRSGVLTDPPCSCFSSCITVDLHSHLLRIWHSLCKVLVFQVVHFWLFLHVIWLPLPQFQ